MGAREARKEGKKGVVVFIERYVYRPIDDCCILPIHEE